MKKAYIKPFVGMVMLASERLLGENSGVADDPMAKQQEVEVEEKTGIPSNFSNIWGDKEDED
jgi:hypothetical protein